MASVCGRHDNRLQTDAAGRQEKFGKLSLFLVAAVSIQASKLEGCGFESRANVPGILDLPWAEFPKKSAKLVKVLLASLPPCCFLERRRSFPRDHKL